MSDNACLRQSERNTVQSHAATCYLRAVRLATSILIIILAGRVAACVQVEVPSFDFRSKKISGVIMDHGKPWIGAQVVLSTPWYDEVKGRSERVLTSTVTDKNGAFSFTSVNPGEYTISMEAGRVDLRVVTPKASQNDTVRVDSFADGCERAF